MNIDPFLNSPESLLTICKDVVAALDSKRNGAGLNEKEKQVREISHTIDKLEKAGVQVPDALRSLKTGLVTELAVREEINNAFEKLTVGFSDLIIDLNTKRGKGTTGIKKPSGHKKHSGEPVTSRDVLRGEIIIALKTMGGNGYQKEVLNKMEKQLNGRLLPGDLKLRKSGEIIWRNNACWERFSMKKDGILKSNSPHGIWELNEEYL